METLRKLQMIVRSRRERLHSDKFESLVFERELGYVEAILQVDPPEMFVKALGKDAWTRFARRVHRTSRLLHKECYCCFSIVLCVITTFVFALLHLKAVIHVPNGWALIVGLWVTLSIAGIWFLRWAGVLVDLDIVGLVDSLNDEIAKKSDDFRVKYKSSNSGCLPSWKSAEQTRVLELWGKSPGCLGVVAGGSTAIGEDEEAAAATFTSPSLAHAMPLPIHGPFGREMLPELRSDEVEVVVQNWDSYLVGQAARSDLCTVGDFKFRLAVLPRGSSGVDAPGVGAFIEAEAPPDKTVWCFEGVKFQITLINQIDYRDSIGRADQGSFSQLQPDRGWVDMLPAELATCERGWVGPGRSLLFRAACRQIIAQEQP